MTPEEKMALAFSKEGETAARDFLSRALRMDNAIALKLARLDRIREQGKRITRAMDGIPGGGGEDRISAAAAQAADLEKEVLADYSELLEEQREIVNTIRGVPEGMLRMVLEMRYLQGMPYFRIGMELHVEERHVYRLHREALRHTALILMERGLIPLP